MQKTKLAALCTLIFFIFFIFIIKYENINLYINPIPQPQAIVSVDRSTGVHNTLYPEIVCAQISEQNIWSPGDFEDDIFEVIMSSAQIAVDDREVDVIESPDPDPLLIGRLTKEIYGTDGLTVVGSYQTPTYICFDSSDFTLGVYDVRLEFDDTNGRHYVYRWAFIARHPAAKNLRNRQYRVVQWIERTFD